MSTAVRDRGQSSLSLANVARVRGAAYRLFSALFLYPDAARWRRVVRAASELRPLGDDLAQFGFFGSWQRLLEALAALERCDLTALQAEHVRLYSVDPLGAVCQPYESSYAAPASQHDAGWVVLQLQQVYARSGLNLAPTLNERPDHLSVELEYLSFLCGQEGAAWARAGVSDGVRCLRQEHAFLLLHLGRWVGAFTRRAGAMTTQHLYAITAEALEAFVHHDRDLVGALLTQTERALNAGAGLSRPKSARARPA